MLQGISIHHDVEAQVHYKGLSIIGNPHDEKIILPIILKQQSSSTVVSYWCWLIVSIIYQGQGKANQGKGRQNGQVDPLFSGLISMSQVLKAELKCFNYSFDGGDLIRWGIRIRRLSQCKD